MLYWSIFAPSDVKVQNLKAHRNHEFIVTFAGVLFGDRKQPNEAPIAPSQVQGALTSSNLTLECYCSKGENLEPPLTAYGCQI